MAATKFSEYGALKQILVLLAFFGVTGSSITSVMLYAADSKLDEKYATDEDVASVQRRVETQITSIKTTVETNTRTVQATASSVDSLSLVVMDLQIERLAATIYDLEQDKRSQGANWNQREEANLRSQQAALADLRAQRQIVFNRIIAATQPAQ